MKHLLATVATLTAVAALTGCPTGGARVHTDYDHNVNFRQFRTFSFGEVKTENPFFEDRIRSEVAKDLRVAGLEPVRSGGDLVITAVGATHNRKYYQTYYNSPGFGGWYYGGFGPSYQTTTVEHYKVGTLVMDMYDSHNRRLVWRGTARREIDDGAAPRTRDLDGAIDQMLNGFPPR